MVNWFVVLAVQIVKRGYVCEYILKASIALFSDKLDMVCESKRGGWGEG